MSQQQQQQGKDESGDAEVHVFEDDELDDIEEDENYDEGDEDGDGDLLGRGGSLGASGDFDLFDEDDDDLLGGPGGGGGMASPSVKKSDDTTGVTTKASATAAAKPKVVSLESMKVLLVNGDLAMPSRRTDDASDLPSSTSHIAPFELPTPNSKGFSSLSFFSVIHSFIN